MKTMLSPEARAARNAYMREWRRKHPEKIREYDNQKWERKAAQIQAERTTQAETMGRYMAKGL